MKALSTRLQGKEEALYCPVDSGWAYHAGVRVGDEVVVILRRDYDWIRANTADTVWQCPCAECHSDAKIAEATR